MSNYTCERCGKPSDWTLICQDCIKKEVASRIADKLLDMVPELQAEIANVSKLEEKGAIRKQIHEIERQHRRFREIAGKEMSR